MVFQMIIMIYDSLPWERNGQVAKISSFTTTISIFKM